ncbi:3-deoxy-D-manno-octulosonate 8-phosphate phosphatase, partial [Francisella tularensis subsp. holarctica]|nr:3-deoxy-D-manno-octulosonate 8-phosphate phosphatase [Francisella tularensis subsp. holarctica]
EYLIKQLNLYDNIVDDYIQSGGVR